MKFEVTMKDPDGFYDSIEDAAKESIALVPGLNGEEMDSLTEVRSQTLKDLCEKWFKYGEYLTVEIDTEAQTITVVPVK